MKNDLTKSLFGNKLDKTGTLAEHIQMLNEMNLLNIGELAELAISKKSGVKMCDANTPNIDLVSGKQIKHAQTHFRQGVMIATISRRTTATMLIVITETKTQKQYFLNIPYAAHKHLNAQTISVYFDKNGKPGQSQWWKYRVDSFKELCELAK